MIDQIVSDIRPVAEKHSLTKLAEGKYRNEYGGQYSHHVIAHSGLKWDELFKKAGIQSMKVPKVTESEYLDRMKQALKDLNYQRYPKDIERPKYRLNFRDDRWSYVEFLVLAKKRGIHPDHAIVEQEFREEPPSSPSDLEILKSGGG